MSLIYIKRCTYSKLLFTSTFILILSTFTIISNQQYLSKNNNNNNVNIFNNQTLLNQRFISLNHTLNNLNKILTPNVITLNQLTELEQNLLTNKTKIDVNLFKLYISIYNKTYNSNEEFDARYLAFKKAFVEIIKSKIKYIKGQSKYSIGINKFTDRLDGETTGLCQSDYFKNAIKRLKNYNINNNENVEFLQIQSIKYVEKNYPNSLYLKHKHWMPTKSEYIEELDYRLTHCTTSVRNQLECGSCYSFATMSIIASNRCLRSSVSIYNPPLSTQFLVDCHRPYVNHNGCDGGFYPYIADFLRDVNIVFKEEDYPYEGKSKKCEAYTKWALAFNPRSNFIGRIKFSHPIGYERIMTSLIVDGPIAVSLIVGQNFMRYSQGIFTALDCNADTNLGGHAVVVVGFGVDQLSNTPFWIIKNSWGSNHGINGYWHLERGKDACLIETMITMAVIN